MKRWQASMRQPAAPRTSRSSPRTSAWPTATSCRVYQQRGGCAGVPQGADDAAGGPGRRGEEVEPARPRRRRLPDRDEVVVHPQGREDGLPGRQRRRVRAGHLQGPRAAGLRPAPAARGDADRVLRARLQARLHLHPRRDDARGEDRPGGDRRGLRGRPAGQGPPARAAGRSSWTSRCTAAPARTSAARRRGC